MELHFVAVKESETHWKDIIETPGTYITKANVKSVVDILSIVSRTVSLTVPILHR